ncbi:MAG: zinc ribbon domain-containing protein, partial [Candidatus Thermofonsia bacterium]
MNEQTIHCTECHFENPVGGKFCSNCGAKLPQSTKIICPRCQTPNPHDRLYCDNCGARLISKTGSIEPEQDTTENAPGLKAFTLPTRQPGDTGELDPDAVPDWLKTGQSSTLPSEDNLTVDSENLPRLEDLTPENRDTDDLPDWLIDSQQDDPIIHVPTTITTEHYQALLDREESEGKGSETADLLAQFGQGKTNLPDWLAATTSDQGAEIDSPAYEEAEDDNLDWLESLSQP